MTERKFETDAFDWRGNSEELDIEDPLGFSQSLWEELDSRLLFSTPTTDTLLSDPALYSHGSQESSVHGGFDPIFRASSPRLKRRRMLFSGEEPAFSSCDPPYEPMIEPFKSCVDPLIQDGDGHGASSSMPSIWYRAPDDSQSSLGDNLEPSTESWMETCIEDNDSYIQMDAAGLVSDTPGMWTPKGQPYEEGVLQGPTTPFPSRPSTPGSRASAVRKLNLNAPVAYPFTLVKPSGTEGDVTLTDINQLILTPPSRVATMAMVVVIQGLVAHQDLELASQGNQWLPALEYVLRERAPLQY